MDERRYQIGDKVRIVQYDPGKYYKFGFVEGMQRYCGQIMTISSVYSSFAVPSCVGYHLEEDIGDYMWSISMFEKLPPDELFIDLDLIM